MAEELMFVEEVLAYQMQGERQREPTVVVLVGGSIADAENSWSGGQSSPSTGDFVTFNYEMTWPTNFKLLPLKLLTSPRLTLGSMGANHRRLCVKVWSISEGKSVWEGLPTCLGGKSRKELREEARHRCQEKTAHEGKAGFLHQKAVLQA